MRRRDVATRSNLARRAGAALCALLAVCTGGVAATGATDASQGGAAGSRTSLEGARDARPYRAETGAAHPKRKISPEKLRETIRKVQMRKTGGTVRKPGSAKGTFTILNAQKRVPEEALAPVVETLDKWIRVQAKVVAADPAAFDIRPQTKASSGGGAGGTARHDAAPPCGAGGGLPLSPFTFHHSPFTPPGVVLADCGGPALVVAPEDGYATVDVGALAADGPAPDVLAARLRKETLRAYAFLCGGAYTAKGEPLMRDVRGARDLDAVPSEQFGIETIAKLRESSALYGITPWRQTTYRAACAEGWAPAPTNEFQKAIWEQIRADKERGPANPVTIAPPAAR